MGSRVHTSQGYTNQHLYKQPLQEEYPVKTGKVNIETTFIIQQCNNFITIL